MKATRIHRKKKKYNKTPNAEWWQQTINFPPNINNNNAQKGRQKSKSNVFSFGVLSQQGLNESPMPPTSSMLQLRLCLMLRYNRISTKTTTTQWLFCCDASRKDCVPTDLSRTNQSDMWALRSGGQPIYRCVRNGNDCWKCRCRCQLIITTISAHDIGFSARMLFVTLIVSSFILQFSGWFHAFNISFNAHNIFCFHSHVRSRQQFLAANKKKYWHNKRTAHTQQ